ncbi:MAG TPA: hypothetical protein VFX50_11400, partial [Gemmatimonadales bacterium]|nr:hypothetical protein [Gemmatimonadales bacterium]
AQIGRADAPPGRRFVLVSSADGIDHATRHVIWQDLINVQLAIATLSALSVKTALDSLPGQGREPAA